MKTRKQPRPSFLGALKGGPRHPLDGIEKRCFNDTTQIWNDKPLMDYIDKFTTEGKHKKFIEKLEKFRQVEKLEREIKQVNQKGQEILF